MNKSLLIFLSIMFCLSGCAFSSAVVKTGYLEGYGRLNKGKYLENYWSDANLISEQKYSTIRIKEINVERILNQKNVTAQNCRDWLNNALTVEVCFMRPHFIFENDSSVAQADLEIAVTEIIPGNFFIRLFLGAFGMGRVWVQVEGKVVDTNTKKLIAAFSDRRRSYTNLEGFLDTDQNEEPYLVEKILEEIAKDIISELKQDLISKKDIVKAEALHSQ